MKELVENYELLKQAKSVLEEKIEKIKAKMKDVEAQIYDKLLETGTDGCIINGKKIQVKTKRVYSANDWNMLYTYIMNKQDFSVLQARLSSTRLKELEADGVAVGMLGIKATDLQELSITKASR